MFRYCVFSVIVFFGATRVSSQEYKDKIVYEFDSLLVERLIEEIGNEIRITGDTLMFEDFCIQLSHNSYELVLSFDLIKGEEFEKLCAMSNRIVELEKKIVPIIFSYDISHSTLFKIESIYGDGRKYQMGHLCSIYFNSQSGTIRVVR